MLPKKFDTPVRISSGMFLTYASATGLIRLPSITW
jgi:hypothetical protein